MRVNQNICLLTILLCFCTAVFADKSSYILKQGDVELDFKSLDGFSHTIPDEVLSGFFLDQQRLENTLMDLLNMEHIYAYIMQQGIQDNEFLGSAKNNAEAIVSQTPVRDTFIENLGYSEDELEKVIENFEIKKEYYRLFQRQIYQGIDDSDLEEIANEQYIANKKKYQVSSQKNVSHIFFNTKGLSEDELLEKKNHAQSILKKLLKSESSFKDLALEYSEDPTVQLNSGDLGWFSKSTFNKDLRETVFNHQSHEIINQLLQDDKGLYIVKLNDSKDAYYKPFADVKTQLITNLRNKIAQKKFLEVLTRLSKDKIVVNPNSIPLITSRYNEFQKDGLKTVGGS